jgi:hypothetical protein
VTYEKHVVKESKVYLSLWMFNVSFWSCLMTIQSHCSLGEYFRECNLNAKHLFYSRLPDKLFWMHSDAQKAAVILLLSENV